MPTPREPAWSVVFAASRARFAAAAKLRDAAKRAAARAAARKVAHGK